MRARGRKRPTPGAMNGLEKAYWAHLLARKAAGEILECMFEPLKFRLADRTFYTPDFLVMLPDGTIEIHESKGHWEDDARVKIKVAAEMHPFRFVAVTRQAKKNGGGWAFEAF